MHNSWVSLIPPIIVILAIFVTKNINRSLIIGILSATLIAADFSLVSAGNLTFERSYMILTDIDTLYLYLFLFILGAIISLIAKTGGAYALAHRLAQKKLSKKTTEYSSMLVSALLSIDDYLSTLTVGYVMRPITDRVRISRAKLAFLVHAMADGLIMLLPISSWVTALTSTLDQSGITDHGATCKIISDPFLIYVQTIPFIFYGIFMVFVVALLVKTQLDFGPMARHEQIAQTSGNLFGKMNHPAETADTEKHTGALTDLILPLALLIGIIILGSLWTGNYFLFGGSQGFLDAIKNNTQRERSIIMCLAGTISLVISWLFAALRTKVEKKSLPSLFVGSYKLMSSAIILITLAGILGAILRINLQTGTYLADLLLGSLPLFLLPLIIFLIALFLATITGSSFGSMMLLIPIIIPMLIALSGATVPASPEALPLLLPVLGAIFSGAVCGNHISPISDTTIMVSTSTGVDPAEHAKTQIPYALIAIIASAIAFFLTGLLRETGYWINAGTSLGIGALTCIVLIYGILLLQKQTHKRI